MSKVETHTNEEIQLHILGKLAARKGGDALRKEVAEAMGINPMRIDRAMARCALVQRVTSNGGHHIRYRLV